MKISGIKLLNLKIIKNSKGDILKFLNKKNKFLKSFGEIYFSEINNKKIKGWNYHKKNTCIVTVPFGRVLFRLIDGRKNSKTFNKQTKFSISKNKYRALLIPPGIWFSFKSQGKKAIVVNFMDNIHSKTESIKSNIIKNIRIPK